MASIKPTSVPTKRLAASINASSSSFTLNNIKGWDGNDLTAADFGTKAYGVFRDTTNTILEIFEFDPSTIANASITILRRGMPFDGTLDTEVSANKLTWIRNETQVELGTDVPQLLAHYIDDLSDQTIGGVKSFTSVPATTGGFPVGGNDLTTKDYVLSVVTGGSITNNALVVTGIAGETIAVDQLIYLKVSDGRWWLCDADIIATVQNVIVGISKGSGTSGNTITNGITIRGTHTASSALFAVNTKYYSSNTAGGFSSSAGTNELTVGYATTTTTIQFDPRFDQTAVTPSGFITMYGGNSAPTGWLICDGSAISRTTYVNLFAVIGTNYGSGNGSTTFNIPDLRSSFPLGKGQRTRTITFDGASAVDPSTDQITVTSNDWLYTGQAVALTGSSLPAGLSATTYYVIRVSATVIKLATSVANANDGTAVNITADGSGTCTLTQTLTDRILGYNGGEETHALTDAEAPSHTHTVLGTATTGGAGGGGQLTSSTNTTSSAGSDSPHNNMPPYTVVNYIIKT